MKLSEKVLLVAVVIALGGGAFFYFRGGGQEKNNIFSDFKIGGIFSLGGGKSNIPDVGDGPAVSKEALMESYKNEGGDFSFKYEEGMKATSNVVEEAEIITVEKDAEHGFQVFVASFDEEGPITADRIKDDLPDIAIDNATTIKVDGVDTLAFHSTGDLGDTFEAWAVHGGKLYQIMSRKDQERWMRGILGTWEWE